MGITHNGKTYQSISELVEERKREGEERDKENMAMFIFLVCWNPEAKGVTMQ